MTITQIRGVVIISDNKKKATGSGIAIGVGAGVALGIIYDNLTFGIIFGAIGGLLLDILIFNKKN